MKSNGIISSFSTQKYFSRKFQNRTDSLVCIPSFLSSLVHAPACFGDPLHMSPNSNLMGVLYDLMQMEGKTNPQGDSYRAEHNSDFFHFLLMTPPAEQADTNPKWASSGL